ncbi:MAG TPA: hypothetical protein DHK64_03450, partial [Rhodobiaceae bacterium]|nr:hypothetical protein [Rhodobiaceae bacterium]
GYLVRPVRAASLIARLTALRARGCMPDAGTPATQDHQDYDDAIVEGDRTPALPAADAAALGRLRILVAEDNEINALLT